MGATVCVDFPLVNPLDSVSSGIFHAFLMIINPDGDSLLSSSFWDGNSDYNIIRSISVSSDGSFFIAGMTKATDYPLQCPFDSIYSSAIYPFEGFMAKFAPLGTQVVWSSYLGGESADGVATIRVCRDHLELTGTTQSPDFPVVNPTDSTLSGQDGFIMRIDLGDDIDCDWICGIVDNCPTASNPYQEDNDTDGVGDSCDNCIAAQNPDQFDCDSDGVGDVCEQYVCGDADGSGGDPAVDIDDVVYLINCVFAGGPCPCPPQAGDANCSGGDVPIDIDDIVYLINYIFSSGPAPCAECL